ncbi:hypothetical protein [Melittangium boletus]|uniref:hypothetical protein n=1 Tax=Melittangium boletus TaxID=83453 RepID=UPI003DA581F9
MFSFQCEWVGALEGQERSGLELGHMTFSGPGGACTTRGESRRAMMMGPSLAALLGAVEGLLTTRQGGGHFTAVASSFEVFFQRVRHGALELRGQGHVVGPVDAAELHAALVSGLEEFLPRGGQELAEDAGRGDLLHVLPRFQRLELAGRRSRR